MTQTKAVSILRHIPRLYQLILCEQKIAKQNVHNIQQLSFYNRSYVEWELRCVTVAVCENQWDRDAVCELRYAQVAVCASCNVCEWEFGGVAVCVGPAVCEENAVWGSTGVRELR